MRRMTNQMMALILILMSLVFFYAGITQDQSKLIVKIIKETASVTVGVAMIFLGVVCLLDNGE